MTTTCKRCGTRVIADNLHTCTPKTTPMTWADRLILPLSIAYDFRDFGIDDGREAKHSVSIIDSSPEHPILFLQNVSFWQANLIVEAINAKG